MCDEVPKAGIEHKRELSFEEKKKKEGEKKNPKIVNPLKIS